MGKRTQESVGKIPFPVSPREEYLTKSSCLPVFRAQSRAVIGTTGGWLDAGRMAEAVQNGDIDMCGLGRPLREDPDFVNRVLRGDVVTSKL